LGGSIPVPFQGGNIYPPLQSNMQKEKIKIGEKIFELSLLRK
jgi:hypothetical protein